MIHPALKKRQALRAVTKTRTGPGERPEVIKQKPKSRKKKKKKASNAPAPDQTRSRPHYDWMQRDAMSSFPKNSHLKLVDQKRKRRKKKEKRKRKKPLHKKVAKAKESVAPEETDTPDSQEAKATKKKKKKKKSAPAANPKPAAPAAPVAQNNSEKMMEYASLGLVVLSTITIVYLGYLNAVADEKEKRKALQSEGCQSRA